MKKILVMASMIGCMVWMPAVHAQMAVIDVRAIVQMTQQLRVLQDQLSNARNQLTQAQQQYQALTGRRGMEQLLAGTVRNYLPPDWVAMEAALRGLQSGYASLANQMEAAIRSNAVLTPAQTARLSVDQLDQLQATRRSVALMQVTSREALQASSQRFASLQSLIDAIPTAMDSKASLDRQARIAAEQAMLQNEHTKVMVMNQAVEAEQRALDQRARELAIANFGSLRRLPAIGLTP